METSFAPLANLRVLVVEDETMIMMMLEDFLNDFGCIVQTAPTIERALEALRTSAPDGVLLDMNIRGEEPTAVVEELVSRSIPYLLVTGYGPAGSDRSIIRSAPRLQKPFSVNDLGRKMVEVFHGDGCGRASP